MASETRLRTERSYIEECDFTGDAAEVLAFLHQELDQLSEELRATAKFDVESDEDGTSLILSWKRPETDAERETREHREREIAARQEAVDRATLATLQAKYGAA